MKSSTNTLGPPSVPNRAERGVVYHLELGLKGPKEEPCLTPEKENFKRTNANSLTQINPTSPSGVEETNMIDGGDHVLKLKPHRERRLNNPRGSGGLPGDRTEKTTKKFHPKQRRRTVLTTLAKRESLL